MPEKTRKNITPEQALEYVIKHREYLRQRYHNTKAKWTQEQKEAYNQKAREKYIKKDPALKKKRGRPCKEINYEKYNNSCLLPFKVDEEGFLIPVPSPRLNE
jgi:hypothetical protein